MPFNFPTKLSHLADVIVSDDGTPPTTRANGDALRGGEVWLDRSTAPPSWHVYDLAGTAWDQTGGGVAVDDDGVEVVTEASRLNFGTGLSVTDDGAGDVTIDLSATGDGAYAETIGDGAATSFVVTHDLGTTDVHVQVWDVSGADPVLANGDPSSVEATDTVSVTVAFGAAPTTDQYRVVVIASGRAAGVGPLTADDSVTVTAAAGQSVSAGAYHTVLNLAGAYEVVSGSLSGQRPGCRITIDGVVVVNDTTGMYGRDNNSNLQGTWAVPPCRSTTSLKIEVYSAVAAAREYGWSIITRAL